MGSSSVSANRTRDNGGVQSDLRRFLLDAGASEADVDRALSEGWLPLLALDRLVTPGHPTHTIAEVAARLMRCHC